MIQTIYKVKGMSKNILTTTKLLVVSALFATSVGVMADTQSITATVDVLNAVDLVKGSDISFGTLQVTTSDLDVSTYTLSSDPSATVGTTVNGGTSAIQELTYGNPGSFTIDGVVADSQLTITLPDVATTPIDVPSTGGTPSNIFQITALSAYDLLGFRAVTFSGGVGTIDADSTGSISFNVGGTLSTVLDTTAYADGSYSVDFDVTVAY